jgi:heme oxygenase (biliverdin-IX-beta and delta-forming)
VDPVMKEHQICFSERSSFSPCDPFSNSIGNAPDGTFLLLVLPFNGQHRNGMQLSSSLLQVLRRETASVHRALETLPVVQSLLRPEVTRGDYGEALCRFDHGHRAFEDSLRASPCHPALGDFRMRTNTANLARDLAFLGQRADPLPPVDGAPFVSLGEAVGALYVVEGSMLGGAVITRLMERRLGLEAGEPGLLFFSSAGMDVPGRWALFHAWIARLEGAPDGTNLHEEALAGAFRTFALLRANLEAVPAK